MTRTGAVSGPGNRTDGNRTGSDRAEARAHLEHLTGPSRGRVAWLVGDRVFAGVGGDRTLTLDAGPPDPGRAPPLARLDWRDGTYGIEALDGADIWINGRKTGAADLRHGDMIEFGPVGPMSRYRLARVPPKWTADEILGDSLAYMRSSRRPLAPRVSSGVAVAVRRLLVETTLLFRITVVLALIALAALSYGQFRTDQALKESLKAEARRLEGIATALAQARQEALTSTELRALREELSLRLDTNADRLAVLERRSDAAARVIGNAVPAVAFLQGAYGLRETESGNLLRHVLDSDGNRLESAFGQPVVSPEGDGPPVEFQFNGTGFRITGGQRLATNRHVAEPWTSGDLADGFAEVGLVPEILRLVAYLPGASGPLDLAPERVSADADIAVMLVAGPTGGEAGLTLATSPPRPGDEVIVMGYPTGLKALLAQAGDEFLSGLEQSGATGFWEIAERLSESGLIMPLASRGIVGQVTPGAIIYDAETTHGGSGGPVLNRDGQVVAINAAILPEFGGSNIGVPVAELQRLLADPPVR